MSLTTSLKYKSLQLLVMELTNEQKAKVFAMYWGCPYIVAGVPKPLMVTGYSVEFQSREHDCKLILRTIEQMTSEEKEIYGQLFSDFNATLLEQFLVSIGIAVRLFIAPNHPDNGKTAIELGLAITQS